MSRKYTCVICGWSYSWPEEFTNTKIGWVCIRPTCQQKYRIRIGKEVAREQFMKKRGPRSIQEPGRNIPLYIQKIVKERDGGICQYCGSPAECFDHIMPFVKGGQHTPENLVLACGTCNALLGDQYLGDLVGKRQWIIDKLNL